MKVTLEKVGKKFGKTIAVNNMNLEVKEKDFLVLLGPSGCGKTTMLRLVAGLETPDSGNIYIGDTLVNDLPPKDRNVAMVFQSYALYPYMSVYDNISFPLKIRKVPKGEIRKRVRNIAELLKIEELLSRRPGELSGGQRQRVALGRAMVREPNVFLMDEPLSNLDAKLRMHMRGELKKLHRKLKVTTIYVTHDQAEAMSISKRIAIIHQGVLQQVGSPKEVYDHPANAFVGGFIGSPSMNMWEGEIIEEDGKLKIDTDFFSYPLPLDLKENTTSKITLGVRPEDVAIAKGREPNAISARVDVVEPMGRELLVTLVSGGAAIKMITTSDRTLRIGDKLKIKFKEEKLRIFERKIEKG